jgi:large subunit ribosomal protein L16
VAPIKPNTVLFEIKGVPSELAVEALKMAQYKLPIRTKLLIRNEQKNELI